MGVAPEAIVENLFFEYRLQYMVLSCNLYIDVFLMIISPGARSALPMVVAPEAIAEYFRV
jgi:hypothetical protein